MTLESTINKNRYVGNGATTQFPFTFKIWKTDQILVYVGDGTTEQEVSEQCTVSITASGGKVTFPTAPASGTIIVFRRSMPFTQEDDYRNGTRFDAEEIEDRFDMDCAERQDLKLDADRAVKMPMTSSESGDEFVTAIFQARDDAQAAVETLGGAEAIAQMRDDVLSALESAGDVTGATMVTASGSTEARAIQTRFADFVNVKDYGAKGDGETDDTDAIKAAIQHATLGCLLFPQGTYCISDTLTMTGNGNGAFWFFGESHLKWIGEEAVEDYSDNITESMSVAEQYNVNTYGWAYYAKPMIYIAPAATGTWSRCIIEGGNFNGNDRASIAIKVHSFGALVHGVRVGHVKHCGIALCGNDPGAASSGGVMLSDCYVANAGPSGIGNSASRQQHGLSNDVGIYIHDLDNKIDNSISNFFGDAIVVRSSGNQITNTHTTIQCPHNNDGYVVDDEGNTVSEYPECANVVVDPDQKTSPSGTNWFNNMYFNSGKYLVKSLTGANMNSVVSGGGYFLKSTNVKIQGKDYTEAFLCGGSVCQPFHCVGLTVHHPAYFQVYDYFPNAALASTFMDVDLDILHNSNPSGIPLIDANNIVSQRSEDPVQVCSTTYPIEAGKYALVGCILSFYQGEDVQNQIKYEFFRGQYYAVKGRLLRNNLTGKWTAKDVETVYGSLSSGDLFIDNTGNTVTINGRQYTYHNIYFGSSSTLMNGDYVLNMRALGRLSKIYLFRMHNYSRGTYITALPSDYTSLLS